MIEHFRESFSLGMASEDGVIAIAVEDVTVDRSATKDDVVDRPRVRFEDAECEEGTATAAKQNSYDGSEKPAEAPSSQTISQHNGSSSSSSSVHKHPPSQHRQHVRRDDTPPLDQQVFMCSLHTQSLSLSLSLSLLSLIHI